MPDPPPAVIPGEVVFDGDATTGPAPDAIDPTIPDPTVTPPPPEPAGGTPPAGAPPTATGGGTTTGPAVTTPPTPALNQWDLDQLEHLGTYTAFMFEQLGRGYNTSTGVVLEEPFRVQEYLDLATFIPYAVTLETAAPGVVEISVSNLATTLVKDHLEAKYPGIEQTNLYADTGLDGAAPISPAALSDMFPEFRALNELDGAYGPMFNNPLQLVLYAHPQHRSFLTAATREAMDRLDLSLPLHDRVMALAKPAEFADFLKVGEDQGRFSDVTTMFNAYRPLGGP